MCLGRRSSRPSAGGCVLLQVWTYGPLFLIFASNRGWDPQLSDRRGILDMCTLGTGNDMSESLRHREGPIMASRGWVIASKGKQGLTWWIREQIYTPSCFYLTICAWPSRVFCLCVFMARPCSPLQLPIAPLPHFFPLGPQTHHVTWSHGHCACCCLHIVPLTFSWLSPTQFQLSADNSRPGENQPRFS